MEVRLSSKIISNLLLHLPLNEEGDFCFMGEAIMVSRGGSGGIKVSKVFKTEIIASTQDYTVPKAINNEFSIRIFGAGGGGYGNDDTRGGGGGGWMNNGIIKLNARDIIKITIGSGGNSQKAGGTSSFGTYLSANGGEGTGFRQAGNGASGGGGLVWRTTGGDGYQFGGGGGSELRGGNGGKWGGGGGGGSNGKYGYQGGNGGYYGGGGGSGKSDIGGHGGYYGGGGGGTVTGGNSGLGGCLNVLNINEGFSGLGGNGGIANSDGENGTNTIGWTNLEKSDDGNYYTGTGTGGKAGVGYYAYRVNWTGGGG